MKLFCVIVFLFCLTKLTCANVNLTESGLRSNLSINSINVTTNSNSSEDKLTTDEDVSSSSSDLFGRRFINFLARRKVIKVSKSDSVKNQYLRFAKSIKETTDDFLSTFLPVILRILSDVELSDTCSQQIYRVIQGVYNQETWAFKLIDANGLKLPSGLLSGVTSDLGDYQQCLDIELDSRFQSSFDDHFSVKPIQSSNHHSSEGHTSGHFDADEGSLRPPQDASYDDNDNEEVIVTSSDHIDRPMSSDDSSGRQVFQMRRSLEGQYCLMSFKPLLPNDLLIAESFEGSARVNDRRESGTSSVIGSISSSKKIQSLMHTLYTDALSLKNGSLNSKLIGYISNHLKKFHSLTSFKSGLCVPSGCSKSEVLSIVSKVTKQFELPIQDISIDHECITKNGNHSESIKTIQLVALAIVIGALSLVILGSVVDVFGIQIKRRGVQSITHLILLSFSIRRNLRKLTYFNYVPRNLVSTVEDTSGKFQALHGIRVLIMVWLIITNTFIFGVIYNKIFWIYRDGDKLLERLNSDWVQFIFHGWAAISDVYFSLSGFILTSILLPKLELSKGKFQYFDLITHRLVRLVPLLIGSTCLYILWPLTSSGPIFNQMAHEQLESCSLSWWTNLLFISNWFPIGTKICIPTGWYFSADFQLFLIGPLLVFILHKNYALGHKFLLIISVSFALISTVTSYLFDLTPVLTKAHFLDSESLERFLQVTLFPTYQHLIPFMAGILAASFVYRRSFRRVTQVAKITILVILSVANGSLTLLLPTLSGWNSKVVIPDGLDRSFDESSSFGREDSESGYDDGRVSFIALISGQLMKPLRASLIVWIYICYCTNSPFLFKNLLKCKNFIILSRLSASFCLTHFIPIFYRSYNVTNSKDFTLFGLATDSMVNFIYSLVVALCVYLSFEAPLINFEKSFKKRIEKNEITKLRSLRPIKTDEKRFGDIVC